MARREPAADLPSSAEADSIAAALVWCKYNVLAYNIFICTVLMITKH